MKRKLANGVISAIAFLLLIVLIMDISLMFGQLQQQTRDAGVSRLENISRELEETISGAERLTMEIAIQAVAALPDRETLETYLYRKKG